MRNFLDGMEITVAEATEVFDLAAAYKAAVAAKKPLPQDMAGRVVGLFFEKPSTRTRTSFDGGAMRLGAHTIFLNPQDMQLAREEPLEDTARVLGGYLDMLIMRTHAHDRLHKVAKNAQIPIINGLCDSYHPCQILADLFTARERFGKLEGLTMAYVGDGNNVLHSLLLDCARHGITFRYAVPEGFDPHPGVVERGKGLVANGGSITQVATAEEAVKDAHVIYTDVWFSMGDPPQKLNQRPLFEPFRLTKNLLAKAGKDAAVMHCLPAHTGDEIAPDLFEDQSDFIFLQAHNRLWLQMALMSFLLREV